MYMFKYVTKRLALMLFTFVIIFTMCFVLIKLLPIPVTIGAGQDPEIIYGILEGRGWIRNPQPGENGVWTYETVPVLEQYANYIRRIVTQGDWGVATTYGEYINQSVWKVFVEHLPPTILINIYSSLIGVPVGISAGLRVQKYHSPNVASKIENEHQKKKNIYLRIGKINFGHGKKNLCFGGRVPSVHENGISKAGKVENILEATGK